MTPTRARSGHLQSPRAAFRSPWGTREVGISRSGTNFKASGTFSRSGCGILWGKTFHPVLQGSPRSNDLPARDQFPLPLG